VYIENNTLEEQHVCVIFCFQLWKNAPATFTILEVTFGEQTLEKTQGLNGFPSSEVA